MTTPNPTPTAAVEDAIKPVTKREHEVSKFTPEQALEEICRYAQDDYFEPPITPKAFQICVEIVKKAITHPQPQSAGCEVVEKTEDEMVEMLSPSPVFKESWVDIVRWLQDKFPNGVKII